MSLPGPPYCPSCQCPIPRTGEYCQKCRNEKGYEFDECICYSDCPENCSSKLKHYCCCSIAFDIESCLAPTNDHDC